MVLRRGQYFQDLPGVEALTSDGNLTESVVNSDPQTLILGTASKGVSDRKVSFVKEVDFERVFGKEGSLLQGITEAFQGGATNVAAMRINTSPAILLGVGTDDQSTDPTRIETIKKDDDAAASFSIFYQKPATIGPNAVYGDLQIKNEFGQITYHRNSEGEIVIDQGELIISGQFNAGADIGTSSAFITLRDLAEDSTPVSGEAAGSIPVTPTAADPFDLANAETNAGSHVVYVGAAEIAEALWTLSVGTGAGGVDQIIIDSVAAGYTGGEAVTVDYTYDAEVLYNVIEGRDGLAPSLMELYESLEIGYELLEDSIFDVIVPKGAHFNDKNLADGASIALRSDPALSVGRKYPLPGSAGDALGYMFSQEYDGELLFWWDIDGDGVAEIYPVGIGAASASTDAEGESLTSDSFYEVNFAYQLARFAHKMNETQKSVHGEIAALPPVDFSRKEVSRWIGQEPVIDLATGNVVSDGTGLLGAKFMSKRADRDVGFVLTEHLELPISADFESDVTVQRDTNDHIVDIGKYISISAVPVRFTSSRVSTNPAGYIGTFETFYAGFHTPLPARTAPTNKRINGVALAFPLNKAKVNALNKAGYVTVKVSGDRVADTIKITDSPIASRSDSDFQSLTAIKALNESLDTVRDVADPYIGGPNSRIHIDNLEASVRRELTKKIEEGTLSSFEFQVLPSESATLDTFALSELSIVPFGELKGLTVIAGLARA